MNQYKRIIATIIILFSLHPLTSWAQFYGQLIPEDTTLVHGVLDNGLTYYSIHNHFTKGQAEFMLVLKGGSSVEQEGEYGMSHFVEHMAFAGTAHYPGRSIINTMERMGVNFGPEVNAVTSSDHVLYKLLGVPISQEGRADSCLFMLKEMAFDALISDEAVEAERNVLLEEWRLRSDGSDYAVRKAIYAEANINLPLGDTATIYHATAKQLRDFYRRWYQPQLMAVIAIGDFDANNMADKIREHFGNLPRGTSRLPEPRTFSNFSEPHFFLKKKKGVNNVCIELYTRHPTPDKAKMQTVGYQLDKTKQEMVGRIMSKRLAQTMEQTGQFTDANISVGPYFELQHDASQYYSTITSSLADWEEALATLAIEKQRAKKYGFCEEESKVAWVRKYVSTYSRSDGERKVTLYTDSLFNEWSRYRVGPNERDIEREPDLSKYINHFLYDEFIVGDQYLAELENFAMWDIKTTDLSSMYNELDVDDNLTIIVNCPDMDDTSLPTKEKVLQILQEAKTADLKPFVYEKVVSDWYLPSVNPTAGKITKQKAFKIKAMDDKQRYDENGRLLSKKEYWKKIWRRKKRNLSPNETWTELDLSNGVKVILHQIRYWSDKQRYIKIEGCRKGGWSYFDNEDWVNAKQILVASKVCADDDIYYSITISPGADRFVFKNKANKSTSFEQPKTKSISWPPAFEPDSLETDADRSENKEKVSKSMSLEQPMAKFHSWLTAFEPDSQKLKKEVNRLRAASLVQDNPNHRRQVLEESIPYQSEYRHIDWTSDEIDAIQMEKIVRLNQDYHSNFNGMIIGLETNAKSDVILPLIEKYIASLPSKDKPMAIVDRPEYHLKQYDDSVMVTLDNNIPLSVVQLTFAQEKGYHLNANSVAHLKALASILRPQLEERLRFQHSDVYACSAYWEYTTLPWANQMLRFEFACNPANRQRIQNDIVALMNDVADGKLITRDMVDSFIQEKEKAESSSANTTIDPMKRTIDRYKNDGILIDENDMGPYKKITPQSLRRFASRLLKNGHLYTVIQTTEETD